MIRLIFLMSIFVSLLSGCGTTPSSAYFLLSANAAPTTASNSIAVGVGPVQTPNYLNREQLVLQRTANTLELAPFQRWGEPLQEGVSRVVRLNLSALLQTDNVQKFPWRLDRQPEYAIKLTLLGLDSNGEQAQLIAEWSVARQSKVIAQKLSHLQQATSGDNGAALASAYSALLLQLSEQIATTVERHHNAL